MVYKNSDSQYVSLLSVTHHSVAWLYTKASPEVREKGVKKVVRLVSAYLTRIIFILPKIFQYSISTPGAILAFIASSVG